MKISLITPTGERPEAFALCVGYMGRQSIPWYEWIIVDDGREPSAQIALPEYERDIKIIRPPTPWKPGDNTHGRNLSLALQEVKGDIIFFIEDDDWYDRDYLKEMVSRFTGNVQMVGETDALYYHVGMGAYRTLGNAAFSTLAQTAMTREGIPFLKEVLLRDVKYYDFRLWRSFPKFPKALFARSGFQLGIKGMPGREGIGVGHNSFVGEWTSDDRRLTYLESLIGIDIRGYYDVGYDGRDTYFMNRFSGRRMP